MKEEEGEEGAVSASNSVGCTRGYQDSDQERGDLVSSGHALLGTMYGLNKISDLEMESSFRT